MKLKHLQLRNFRRLENVFIDFEDEETVFVGPNNSGKTSATAAFRQFLSHRDFAVHDFSVSQIAVIDAFGIADEADKTSTSALPAIEMDLWFTVDPEIEYYRVDALLPNLSGNMDEVGIRLSYQVKDARELKADYDAYFPALENGRPAKPLSHFLSLQGNLNRHFELRYFALARTEAEPRPSPLESSDGKRILHSMLRVDFVDAQRNIDDHELGKSTRLSSVFAAFYKRHLTQAEANDNANRIIDEHNGRLTEHYEEAFSDLLNVIANLGVPSVNDRRLRLVSSLSPEVALQGNTALIYVDPELSHELPESYNGLGFKNLIYLAIQISHFHLQWMNTTEKRPLSQIIFIEEPEAHLHAQVQQTFISNVWAIIQRAAARAGMANGSPQLCITTHSSHILDAVEFEKVRYFRRCPTGNTDAAAPPMLHASRVLSMRQFMPRPGETMTDAETLRFLKQYLKLTHCDLFFADAAILVEGAAEKLLMTAMIARSAPLLGRNYVTVLEVGGAFSHCFASLLEFLGIPYLVITDLDSVDPAKHHAACRADAPGAITSNQSLKFFIKRSLISDLAQLDTPDLVQADGCCFIAFQRPLVVAGYENDPPMHARTFEEAFAHQNIALLRDGTIKLGATHPERNEYSEEYGAIHDRVHSKSFKKTEFALHVAASTAQWSTPKYIDDGLKWLEGKLNIAAAQNTAK